MPNPESLLDTLFDAAQRHGDESGSEAEIGDLQQVLVLCWEHMAPMQRRAVLRSTSFEDLRETPEYEKIDWMSFPEVHDD
jgi:hypothetical protein